MYNKLHRKFWHLPLISVALVSVALVSVALVSVALVSVAFGNWTFMLLQDAIVYQASLELSF